MRGATDGPAQVQRVVHKLRARHRKDDLAASMRSGGVATSSEAVSAAAATATATATAFCAVSSTTIAQPIATVATTAVSATAISVSRAAAAPATATAITVPAVTTAYPFGFADGYVSVFRDGIAHRCWSGRRNRRHVRAGRAKASPGARRISSRPT